MLQFQTFILKGKAIFGTRMPKDYEDAIDAYFDAMGGARDIEETLFVMLDNAINNENCLDEERSDALWLYRQHKEFIQKLERFRRIKQIKVSLN